jgi:hypothetical protein
MNIFWLCLNLKLCAQMHCDKHVVKMILEYAQLLSSVHHFFESEHMEVVYKKTHINHPCSKWARESDTNYKMLYELFVHLCDEYTYRYNKVHKTETKLKEILKNVPVGIPIGKMTNPPIAITDKTIKVKQGDKYLLVGSYRNYYNISKRHFAKWTKRDAPQWFLNYT